MAVLIDETHQGYGRATQLAGKRGKVVERDLGRRVEDTELVQHPKSLALEVHRQEIGCSDDDFVGHGTQPSRRMFVETDARDS